MLSFEYQGKSYPINGNTHIWCSNACDMPVVYAAVVEALKGCYVIDLTATYSNEFDVPHGSTIYTLAFAGTLPPEVIQESNENSVFIIFGNAKPSFEYSTQYHIRTVSVYKYVQLALIALQVISIAMCLQVVYSSNDTAPIALSRSRFYYSAAHVKDINPRYELLYTDKAHDTAIYLDTEWKPVLPPNVPVLLGGTISGTVTETIDDYSFIVTVDKPSEIYAGLSGTAVTTATGEDVGFVSGICGEGQVKCIGTN